MSSYGGLARHGGGQSDAGSSRSHAARLRGVLRDILSSGWISLIAVLITLFAVLPLPQRPLMPPRVDGQRWVVRDHVPRADAPASGSESRGDTPPAPHDHR